MHFFAAIENIFFLILIAIVALIRWAFAATEAAKNADAKKRAQQQPSPNAPVSRAPAQTEEERVRRFMEALGVPTSNAPPPKMLRRRVEPRTPRQPKGKVRPIDPFPAPRPTMWQPEPVIVEPPAEASARLPLPVSVSPSEPTVPREQTPAVFEVHVVTGRAEEAAPGSPAIVRQKSLSLSRSWAARLAETGGLRDAIILREIFGPPRGLQQQLTL